MPGEVSIVAQVAKGLLDESMFLQPRPYGLYDPVSNGLRVRSSGNNE